MKNYLYELDDINNYKGVLSFLKKYGICIIRNYISRSELENLRNEHHSLLYGENKSNNTKKHPLNKDGWICTTNRKELEQLGCYHIIETCYSDSLKSIADAYYPNGLRFNEDIFLTNEKDDKNPILPWHHDRIQALKFYINLKDVTTQDGAFEYVPGSHRDGFYRANYYLVTGCPIEKIPNDIPDEEILHAESITVNAGDLIIFDADGFHRGGIVAEGHERQIIRAHTNPLPYFGYSKPRLLSKEWWIQSPFNLASLYKTNIGRTLGDEFKPGTTQGKYRT